MIQRAIGDTNSHGDAKSPSLNDNQHENQDRSDDLKNHLLWTIVVLFDDLENLWWYYSQSDTKSQRVPLNPSVASMI